MAKTGAEFFYSGAETMRRYDALAATLDILIAQAEAAQVAQMDRAPISMDRIQVKARVACAAAAKAGR